MRQRQLIRALSAYWPLDISVLTEYACILALIVLGALALGKSAVDTTSSAVIYIYSAVFPVKFSVRTDQRERSARALFFSGEQVTVK